jgi:rod shape-determining protein MreD
MKPFYHLLRSIPFLSVLFLVMGGASLRLAGYPLLPALYLIPVYYWLIFRPEGLPLWSLFGIGLIYDSLMGNELGFSSVLLMGSGFLGPYTRPLLLSLSFSLIWGAFGVYSFLFLLVYGLFMGGDVSLIVSWFYGFVLYPILVWMLSHLYLRLHAHV